MGLQGQCIASYLHLVIITFRGDKYLWPLLVLVNGWIHFSLTTCAVFFCLRELLFRSRADEIAALREFSDTLVRNLFPESLWAQEVNRCALNEIVALKGKEALNYLSAEMQSYIRAKPPMMIFTSVNCM